MELKTDDGVRGVSETYGGEGPLAGLESVRERVIGMDPFRLSGLLLGLLGRTGHDVAVTCFADVAAASRLDAVQVVLSDPHYWGGMRQLQLLSNLTEVLGMSLSMHSNSHWVSV